MAPTGQVLALLTLCTAVGAATEVTSRRYDAIVLGGGIKESLVAALLASHGRQVQRERAPGGDSASLALDELYVKILGKDAKPESKLGKPEDYSIDVTPKALLASGDELEFFTRSGLWNHMDFRRVHRSFIYRLRPDGQPDVHRVIANSEDILKTRMLPPVDKARVIQLFAWIEQFDEENRDTFVAGKISKKKLALYKMSALAFFKFWEISPPSAELIAQGLARHSGNYKSLKRLPAIELVRALRAYKNAYRTFPHMTSPYVFPMGGIGASLHKAASKVLQAHDGASLSGEASAKVLFDESGSACGVSTKRGDVRADCVVAAASCVPERATGGATVVRLYALMTHPPNKCKDAKSCQLLLPAAACGRKHDIHIYSSSAMHGVSPPGTWLATAATVVEGDVDGATAMTVAKRELAAALPLLKPTRKMVASVCTTVEPNAEAGAEGLFLLSSCDETTLFKSLVEEVTQTFKRVTGEDF